MATYSLFDTRNPWNSLYELVDEVNRAFGGWPRAAGTVDVFPPVNGYVNEDGAVVRAELPGIDPETLDVQVHQGKLRLAGDRAGRARGENETWYRRERFSGRFEREFTLPFRPDPDSVAATYRDGVLTVTVERAAEDKPRRITVNAD